MDEIHDNHRTVVGELPDQASVFIGVGQSQAIWWLVMAALTGSVVIIFLSIACCGSRRDRADSRRPGTDEYDDDDEPLHYTMIFIARRGSQQTGDDTEKLVSTDR